MEVPKGLKHHLYWHEVLRAKAVRKIARLLRVPTVVEYNRMGRYR